ncbi:MAG: hypothetical protein JWP75_1949, partial [Frondihabitans sp.]|nr:hypothetical protein [Frondihabitans sp.]
MAVDLAIDELRVTLGSVEVRLDLPRDAPVRLVGLAVAGRQRTQNDRPHVTPLVELSLAGESHVRHSHDVRHRNYAASDRLRLVSYDVGSDSLTVTQIDSTTGILVETRLRTGTPSTVTVENRLTHSGAEDVVVEYLSSLVLGGFAEIIDADVFERLRSHTGLMAWTAEYRWQERSLAEVGLVDAGIPHATSSTRTSFSYGGVGSWSSSTHLPMGALEDPESNTIWMWQIEHNGPWWSELDDVGRDAALSLSGPTYRQHHWQTRLRTGTLPVIANDYMNCLMGDPSTEKLLPLVDSAAFVGADYFVIDAGWYADDAGWWSTVGEWRESTIRFPNGLAEVTDRIRDRGMTPGLWLEPEVMGVNSPAVVQLPAEAFFRREGRAVAEQGRYHLDFRHPAVRARLDETVDRLVADYGIGYFKFDYNINIGEGTEVDAESLGEGLLGHDRAYVGWLTSVRRRHPELILENCSSGAMRADAALLSVAQLQSTSDQESPIVNAVIACGAPSNIAPEQAAVWSYPQPEWSDDLIDFTMVQSILARVHLGGRHDLLSAPQLQRVKNAVDVHKSLGGFIQVAVPFWPLGTPGWSDEW